MTSNSFISKLFRKNHNKLILSSKIRPRCKIKIYKIFFWLIFKVFIFYALCALIRLAYFDVTEIIRTENLTFTYPQNNIPTLKNVSLSINSGDFITVCGATGSGKSTFLKMLKICRLIEK